MPRSAPVTFLPHIRAGFAGIKKDWPSYKVAIGVLNQGATHNAMQNSTLQAIAKGQIKPSAVVNALKKPVKKRTAENNRILQAFYLLHGHIESVFTMNSERLMLMQFEKSMPFVKIQPRNSYTPFYTATRKGPYPAIWQNEVKKMATFLTNVQAPRVLDIGSGFETPSLGRDLERAGLESVRLFAVDPALAEPTEDFAKACFDERYSIPDGGEVDFAVASNSIPLYAWTEQELTAFFGNVNRIVRSGGHLMLNGFGENVPSSIMELPLEQPIQWHFKGNSFETQSDFATSAGLELVEKYQCGESQGAIFQVNK